MATMTRKPRSKTRVHNRQATAKAAVPNAIRELRHQYGLSQALLARLMDVSLRTLSTAESRRAVSPQMRRAFTQVNRLCDALAHAMRPAYVGTWLDQPNDLLGELKPVERIERGQIDLVWQVAEGLRSGSQL